MCCLEINRLVDFGEEKLGVTFRNDSITWGESGYDDVLCNYVPYGYFRRQNEQLVLPHAIGCQNPTVNQEYRLFLQGWI